MSLGRARELRTAWPVWYGCPLQRRWNKILTKQTHHRPEKQQKRSEFVKPEVLHAHNIPHYDLRDLPQEFDSLRRDKHSQVQKWIAAITHAIGDKCVIHPNKLQDKDHFQIKHRGMVYFLYAPSNHKQDGHELTPQQKKALLNALAHMGVFGHKDVKPDPDDE
ncbi:unnamed protein product [Symbiodinium natans]|uniref:Uncharacterized protein n=1 Tax=Symbiodinium natans TaxID=878477 RepID=A0A812PRQ3_9DINO|nr:unnamed protein product [Symbiodinium natans]